MGCSLRSSRAVETGAGRWPGKALFRRSCVLATELLGAAGSRANVHSDATPAATFADPVDSGVRSFLRRYGRQTSDSNFLERLGYQAAAASVARRGAIRTAGAPRKPSDGQAFRTWGEAYGISSKTGQQGNFVGD